MAGACAKERPDTQATTQLTEISSLRPDPKDMERDVRARGGTASTTVGLATRVGRGTLNAAIRARHAGAARWRRHDAAYEPVIAIVLHLAALTLAARARKQAASGQTYATQGHPRAFQSMPPKRAPIPIPRARGAAYVRNTTLTTTQGSYSAEEGLRTGSG